VHRAGLAAGLARHLEVRRRDARGRAERLDAGGQLVGERQREAHVRQFGIVVAHPARAAHGRVVAYKERRVRE